MNEADWHTLQEEMEDELSDIFHEIDTNYNGEVQVPEFQAFLTKLGKRGIVLCEDITNEEMRQEMGCLEDSVHYVDK